MDDTQTETQDIPGGTETKSGTHSESSDGTVDISKNVTEEEVTGVEANEI